MKHPEREYPQEDKGWQFDELLLAAILLTMIAVAGIAVQVVWLV